MFEVEEQLDLCIICCKAVRRVPPEGITAAGMKSELSEQQSGVVEPLFTPRHSTLFPGSNGSLLLNEQLRLYFVASELFKLSETEARKFLAYLAREDPRFWLKMCGSCGSIVNQAVEVHEQILRLKDEIDKIGCTLFQTMEVGDVSLTLMGIGDGKLSKAVRDMLRSPRERKTAALLGDSVKTEIDLSAFHFDDEVFAVVGESSLLEDEAPMSDFENIDSLQAGKERQKQSTVIRKRKSKCSDYSSSDSDYEPPGSQKRAISKKRAFDRNSSRKITTESTAASKVWANKFKTPKGFQCNLCQSCYKSPKGLGIHFQAHEESKQLDGKFDCPKCGHPNLSEEKLRRHLVKIHETLKNTCTICGHVAHRRWLHEKHMLRKHNIKIWTPMSEAGAEASNSLEETGNSRIPLHDQQSEGGDTVVTELQEGGIGEESSFWNQPRRGNRKSNELENINSERVWQATRNIESSAAFKTLVERARISRTENGFQCKFCRSCYSTVAGFKKHLMAHEQSKQQGNKFDCSICGHPNLSEEKLRRHLVKLHETLKNTCTICGHVAQRRWLHEKHMLKKHNIKVWTPMIKTEAEKEEIAKPDKTNESTNAHPEGDSPPEELKDHDALNNRPQRLRSRRSYKVDDDMSAEEGEDDKINKPRNDDEWIPSVEDVEHDEVEQVDISSNEDVSVTEDDESDDEWKAKRKPAASEEGLYHCNKCGADYKSARGFQRHKEEHKASIRLNHKFDCQICGFPCSSDRRLRCHRKRAHKEIPWLHCKICGYKVIRPCQLRLHMQNKHDPANNTKTVGRPRKYQKSIRPDGKFGCSTCSAHFKSSDTLQRHMKDHEYSKMNDGKFDCDVCNFPCSNEERLRRHKNLKHEKTTPTCKICNKQFHRPHLLRLHEKMHQEHDEAFNPATGNFDCQFCEGSFETMRGLQMHRFNAHKDQLGPSSFVLCPHCGDAFANPASLSKHVRALHENRFTCTCDVCGKGFDGQKRLELHKITHEKNRIRQFVCEVCGTGYSYHRTLLQHKAKFHPETVNKPHRKPEKEGQHKCKWCDKVFPFKYALVNHIPSHKELYNYNCEVCGKSYISASSLRLHVEITHSQGTEKVACEHCGKEFPHKHYVICHYRYCKVKREKKARQKNSTKPEAESRTNATDTAPQTQQWGPSCSTNNSADEYQTIFRSCQL